MPTLPWNARGSRSPGNPGIWGNFNAHEEDNPGGGMILRPGLPERGPAEGFALGGTPFDSRAGWGPPAGETKPL